MSTMSTEYNRQYYLNNREKKRETAAKYYEDNKAMILTRATRHNSKLGAQNREAFRWYKSTKGCADCGITDPIVLEFDHIRADKGFSIGGNAHVPIAKLWKEIQKCEVVCSNCHRLRTHMRKVIDALL